MYYVLCIMLLNNNCKNELMEGQISNEAYLKLKRVES